MKSEETINDNPSLVLRGEKITLSDRQNWKDVEIGWNPDGDAYKWVREYIYFEEDLKKSIKEMEKLIMDTKGINVLSLAVLTARIKNEIFGDKLI